MAYLVGELERRGYLERRPDPEDGRARLIHVTDRGEQAIRAIRGAVKRVERDWQRALGAARFAELRNTLVELSARGEPDRGLVPNGQSPGRDRIGGPMPKGST